MVSFSNHIHLLIRFPELADSQVFNKWLVQNPSTCWHETKPDADGELNVIVQSDDGKSVFAAQLIREDANNDEESRWGHTVSAECTFELGEIQVSKAKATASVIQQLSWVQSDQIIAIRPVVGFKDNTQELRWEIEIAKDQSVVEHLVFQGKDILSSETRVLGPLGMEAADSPSSGSPASDWLASNECHHLNQWRKTAQQMASGATTSAEKAKKIWSGVRSRMRYDANIKHISEFTHSDNLTISRYNWAGICDEWAVVQITLLRALGISANLKFLIWNQDVDPVGHACLEWMDGNVWRHMDSLWNAFDDKSVYRNKGAQNVTVMDAFHPRDSRSTTPAWRIPDITGDQKFHPYKDFLISPRYPGGPRPGYS